METVFAGCKRENAAGKNIHKYREDALNVADNRNSLLADVRCSEEPSKDRRRRSVMAATRDRIDGDRGVAGKKG
jgi:hypothetical protein